MATVKPEKKSVPGVGGERGSGGGGRNQNDKKKSSAPGKGPREKWGGDGKGMVLLKKNGGGKLVPCLKCEG